VVSDGKVFFRSSASPSLLLELRCVERVFACVMVMEPPPVPLPLLPQPSLPPTTSDIKDKQDSDATAVATPTIDGDDPNLIMLQRTLLDLSSSSSTSSSNEAERKDHVSSTSSSLASTLPSMSSSWRNAITAWRATLPLGLWISRPHKPGHHNHHLSSSNNLDVTDVTTTTTIPAAESAAAVPSPTFATTTATAVTPSLTATISTSSSLSLPSIGRTEPCDPIRFRVSCKCKGYNWGAYTPQSISSSLSRAVHKHYGWRLDYDDNDLEIFVHLNDRWMVVGLPLFRQRGTLANRSYHIDGGITTGIRSTVAASMARLVIPHLPPNRYIHGISSLPT
jgi:hypothetical protein